MIHVANPTFGAEEQEAVQTILESGMVADGPEVRDFESEFAEYCGADHAAGVANGTAALVAALKALEIGNGDRVVTTPFSFVASTNAIRLVGAEPVFADIDPETYNLDPADTRETVRAVDADAILAVHLYGLPADVAALEQIAEEEDVLLVEDAAQAHGAAFEGETVGTFGDAAAFSFYPTKNMTTGEGGMVLTDDEAVADRVASYINHGRATEDSPYAHESVGHNLRMTSIAAAIGRVQLEKLPGWIEARRDNADALSDGLTDVLGVEAPAEPEGYRHAYHQYTVRTENRERLMGRLKENGIGSAVYYPTAIPELRPYEGYNADVPVAKQAAESVLSLPVHPGVSDADIEQITETIRAAAPQRQ